MFTKYILNLDDNLFNDLIKLSQLENISNGRKGAVLIDYKNNRIPIIRTTTQYKYPSQKFNSIHYDIIKSIKNITNINDLEFNNALIEVYDSTYRTMKEHTDQALDIADNSYICLYSCYNNIISNNIISNNKPLNNKKKYIRTLQIKEKENINNKYNISLEHNSIVIFSKDINKSFLHKIILNNNKLSGDLWLGITFRLSKTYIQFINEIPYFINSNIQLQLATEEEKKDFFIYKQLENKLINFTYPTLFYTISIGDILNVNI